MAEELQDIKKKIVEQKEGDIAELKKKLGDSRKQKEQEKAPAVDMTQVEKIVERMKKKYAESGVPQGQPGGKLGELKEIIAQGEAAKINVQTVEDLQEFRSPVIRQLGKFYLLFRLPLESVSGFIKRLPLAADIRYYLYSANMKYSLNQWLAIVVSASALAGFFTLVVAAAVAYYYEAGIAYPIIIAGIAGMLTLLIMLLLPKSRAGSRGEQVSIELPFALRHMATELKAGIGLYKTIQTIAVSDYGILSEEFARTVSEIEEGTDAKDALRHFALRTQSKSLRNALLHVVRAMKTGGNLSDIMNTIAEEVSFDMRIKVRDYAEQMNFFGVIYIFIGIVMPVFIAVIGSVVNAPISIGNVSVPPIMIALVYLLGMPLILGLLIVYLKMSQPRV